MLVFYFQLSAMVFNQDPRLPWGWRVLLALSDGGASLASKLCLFGPSFGTSFAVVVSYPLFLAALVGLVWLVHALFFAKIASCVERAERLSFRAALLGVVNFCYIPTVAAVVAALRTQATHADTLEERLTADLSVVTVDDQGLVTAAYAPIRVVAVLVLVLYVAGVPAVVNLITWVPYLRRHGCCGCCGGNGNGDDDRVGRSLTASGEKVR